MKTTSQSQNRLKWQITKYDSKNSLLKYAWKIQDVPQSYWKAKVPQDPGSLDPTILQVWLQSSKVKRTSIKPYHECTIGNIIALVCKRGLRFQSKPLTVCCKRQQMWTLSETFVNIWRLGKEDGIVIRVWYFSFTSRYFQLMEQLQENLVERKQLIRLVGNVIY